MELRHLRYFIALSEEMNFRKAAERLNMSQPPLSRQIAALEREIGTRLTQKKGRTFTLTPAGAYFRDEAKKVVNAVSALERQTRIKGETEDIPLRIGCVGSQMVSSMPDLASFLKERVVGLRIEIEEMDTETQGRAILAGNIDFGILRSWVARTGVRYERLGDEALSLLYPESMGDGTERDIAAFARYPFIKGTAPGLSERILAICGEAGFAPSVSVECSQFASIVRLVAVGLGWTIAPQQALLQFSVEGTRMLDLGESIEFGIAYREGNLPEKIVAAVEAAKEFMRK
jgi:DNA-binding transcriptional LysR family regulator